MTNLQDVLLKAEEQLSPNNFKIMILPLAEVFVNLQFIQEIFSLPTDFKLEILILTDEE